jgi:hypothetical protein
VSAFSSVAYSSPVSEWEPRPKSVTRQVTRTLAVMAVWRPLSPFFFRRSKFWTVWTVYSLVQPSGVRMALSRSVYAR